MALFDLYFLNYNNYFNRTIKKYNTLQEYINDPGYIDSVQAINFIEGDGIATEQIINWNKDIPNYMIAMQNDKMERWFVIESERTRGGQFKLSLRRDVISDNIESVLKSPTFIEKATISDTDPFIFNDEGMQVNQILRSQTLLKDETGLAWICAYIPRHKDISGEAWYNKEVKGAVSNPSYNLIYNSLDELGEAVGVGKRFLNSYDVRYQGLLSSYNLNKEYVFQSKNNRSENRYNEIEKGTGSYWLTRSTNYDSNTFDDIYTGLLADNNYYSANGLWDINYTYNDKIVKISDTLYRLKVVQIKKTDSTSYYASPTSNLYLSLKSTQNVIREYGSRDRIVSVESVEYIELKLDLQPINDESAIFKISTSRRGLVDQPYDMLIFPYDVSYKGYDIRIDGSGIMFDSTAMINIATKLAETWGSDVVYDVQILPYFPCRDLLKGDVITLSSVDEGSKYTRIYNADNEPIGICFYGRESSGTFNIQFEIPFEGGKLQVMSEMYRLCSPNYSSAYELRVFENYGINYFNVDYTYLPYQPFIKLNPNFKGLNGIESDDSRGLILGGNFSITTLSSAWANYQLNNVNYQAIFDRQVKNAKTNYKLGLIENLTGGIIGGVGQATAGAIATGNPLVGGALAGANAVGLVADYTLEKLKYKENLSYSKDQFNYNLQNVQARPETISKMTSFNYDSMYFPFVEFYSCTDEEKQAITNKLQYNGMTVMRIGTIDEFVKDTETFIQGKVIRFLDLDDDYHMAVELADEIKKGIFIKRSDV